MSDSIFDVIDRRFMSGNSVSVERVHIKSDEWTDLKYELFAAREENERVRQASLNVMMHFGDMKATKDKLEADLDRALARVAELEEQAQQLICSGTGPLADATDDYLRGLILRKQAEAVEVMAEKVREGQEQNPEVVTAASIYEGLLSYASSYRNQADQLENTHD
mgnify:CR=1 FL=1